MIYIKSKLSGKTIETICNDEDFSIDKDNIYSKDDFGNKVSWKRIGFYAEKPLH